MNYNAMLAYIDWDQFQTESDLFVQFEEPAVRRESNYKHNLQAIPKKLKRQDREFDHSHK